MALFKRSDLEAQGLTKDQIEYIMTESGRSLGANYMLKTDMQAQIDAAVAAAKPAAVDPKTTPEYMEIAKERDMLRAIGSDDFASVKPKFREQVYGMIDRGEGAKPIAEQLTAIKEKFEEYYLPSEPAESTKNTPQYSKPTPRVGANNDSPEEKLYSELSQNWK